MERQTDKNALRTALELAGLYARCAELETDQDMMAACEVMAAHYRDVAIALLEGSGKTQQ